MRLASKPVALAAALFASFAAQSPARAAYIVTFSEVGPNAGFTHEIALITKPAWQRALRVRSGCPLSVGEALPLPDLA